MNIVPRCSVFNKDQITTIEDCYKAKFIGDFPLKAKDGAFVNFPIAVFYQENPDLEKGHSNYFGLFRDSFGTLVITNAECVKDYRISAILDKLGNVIYSSYRHDFFGFQGGEYWIDGGMDYCRTNAPSENWVTLMVYGDHLVPVVNVKQAAK